MSGTSFNVYDPARGKWRQTWVDDRGGLLLLDGELRDGKMVLADQRPSRREKGVTLSHRISWEKTDADRVRQLREASKDGGQSWTVVFDGLYVKAK